MLKDKLEAKNTIENSALEQIKALELEIARRVAALVDEGKQAEANAQKIASEIINSVQKSGVAEAEKQYQKIIMAAQSQAQAIIEDSRQKSRYLNQQEADLINQVKQYAIHLLLGSLEDD